MENTIIDNFDSNKNENQFTENLGNSTKKKLRFKNLTEGQKKTLMNGGSGLAGMMLGVGALSLMGFANKDGSASYSPEEVNADECVDVFTDAPIASTINNDMSFSEAFEAARSEVGVGGFFTHKGNVYNTYTREEWDEMSDEDKTDYANSIAEKVHEVREVSTNNDSLETPITLKTNANEAVVDENDQKTDDVKSHDEEHQDEPIDANNTDKELLEISEDDILHKIDEGKDYVIDGYEVDFDKDEYFDAIIDADKDGKYDELMLDVNNPDGHSAIIDIQPIDTDALKDLDLIDGDGNLLVERHTPIAGKEVEIANNEISISTDDLGEGMDLNLDGVNETFIIDANHNKIDDVAIDLDGDNEIDNIFIDVNSVEKDIEIQEYLEVKAEVEVEHIEEDLDSSLNNDLVSNDLQDDLSNDLSDDFLEDDNLLDA